MAMQHDILLKHVALLISTYFLLGWENASFALQRRKDAKIVPSMAVNTSFEGSLSLALLCFELMYG